MDLILNNSLRESYILQLSLFAWEQRKVSDLAEKTYGGGTPTTSNEAYWNGDIPWIQSSDVVDGKLLGVEPRKWITQDGLNNSAAQLIPGNSIAIITRVGVGKLAFMPYSYATSQDFLSLSKLNAEPLFTVYACYKKLQSELNAVQGTSIKGITKDELLAKNIMVPRYAEQQQIGAFFKQLDNLITLHQRKYDKLTNVKKSMLEKMFPKNGSNVPEIRFKGFTEAWEQRELWELTIWDKKFNEVEAEKQPKIVKYPYVLADVFSKIEDASGDVRLLSTGNYIGYTTDEKAGKNLCVGEVVAIPWGGVPNIKYYKGKFVTADNRIATSNDTETLGNRFLSLYLEHSLAFLQSIYRGASIKHPSMNDVLSMQISIPHIQEQREIETWFANLDNLITLHQRELEKLKNLKKACLEKMFV